MLPGNQTCTAMVLPWWPLQWYLLSKRFSFCLDWHDCYVHHGTEIGYRQHVRIISSILTLVHRLSAVTGKACCADDPEPHKNLSKSHEDDPAPHCLCCIKLFSKHHLWPSTRKPCIMRWISIWDTGQNSRLWRWLSIFTFWYWLIEEWFLYTKICFVASRTLYLPSYGSRKSGE